MDMKYSIKGQIISVILSHLKAVFLFFIVWTIDIAVISLKIGGAIYTVTSTILYFIIMYSACYSQAKNDKKSYSPLTPKKYKGILLSMGVLVMSIFVVFGYIFVWQKASDGENLINLWAVAVNIFYLFWFSPFISFLGKQKGTIAITEYAIAFIIPIASCFLGYLAGYKNFDIAEKMRFLVYEKKK